MTDIFMYAKEPPEVKELCRNPGCTEKACTYFIFNYDAMYNKEFSFIKESRIEGYCMKHDSPFRRTHCYKVYIISTKQMMYLS